jgi:hypothetical protein
MFFKMLISDKNMNKFKVFCCQNLGLVRRYKILNFTKKLKNIKFFNLN